MIMYTTMPFELIFQENDSSVYMKRSTINVAGVDLVVEAISPEECRVVQVLSTNPYDFLNENYYPGSLLSLKSPLIK